MTKAERRAFDACVDYFRHVEATNLNDHKGLTDRRMYLKEAAQEALVACGAIERKRQHDA